MTSAPSTPGDVAPRRRRERPDDGAASEVVGYILMFGISSVILVLSLQAFHLVQGQANQLSAGAEMESVGNQVATRIVQAGLIAQDLPNATFQVSVRIPAQVASFQYQIVARDDTVYVNTTDGMVRTNTTTFNTEALQGIRVSGDVFSSARTLLVTYHETPAGVHAIEIKHR